MPHDSECVDCGEHNPSAGCLGCDSPLCRDCYLAGRGYCDGCLDLIDDDELDMT